MMSRGKEKRGEDNKKEENTIRVGSINIQKEVEDKLKQIKGILNKLKIDILNTRVERLGT
jgi:hypothetical protein